MSSRVLLQSPGDPTKAEGTESSFGCLHRGHQGTELGFLAAACSQAQGCHSSGPKTPGRTVGGCRQDPKTSPWPLGIQYQQHHPSTAGEQPSGQPASGGRSLPLISGQHRATHPVPGLITQRLLSAGRGRPHHPAGAGHQMGAWGAPKPHGHRARRAAGGHRGVKT